jgi:hypothetical protein
MMMATAASRSNGHPIAKKIETLLAPSHFRDFEFSDLPI